MMKTAVGTLSCLFWVTSARADAIRLQVLGPDKKPVAGAKVRVVEVNGYLPDLKPAMPLDLTSDADGKIAFESKKPLVALEEFSPLEMPNLSLVNSVYARISAPGMAVAAQALQVGDNQITLQAGRSFGGVALDEDQKPVADVQITLSNFIAADETKSQYLPREIQLQTVTDAAGKWSFAAMPRAGTVQIEVDNSRFVRETLQFSLEAGAAPPLFLERGAIIKGRLLKPDGSGAAGVSLFPGGENGGSPFRDEMKTAPDGSFEFSSLRAGDFYVQHLNFRGNESLPFVLDIKPVKGLKVGEVRDLGAWKAQTGVLVKGKIVASGTKTPIPGASMTVYGMSYASGQVDKSGVFSFRASEDAGQGGVSAPGFVSVQKSLPAAVNGVLDLGTTELKRAIEVKGTLKDKSGRAAPRLQVVAQSANGSRVSYAYTDAAGHFAFNDLAAGTYTLKIDGQQLVGEVKFSVVAGQKIAPLSGVVEAESRADAPKMVSGRALDGAGKAVAGAKIVLSLRSGPSSQKIRAISGVDGRFEARIGVAGATPKVVSAARPGLVFARGAEFKMVGGVWRADLVFQGRGVVLRGRVVSAAGVPVARAFVAVAGRDDLPVVVTDATGAFALPDAPTEGVTLLVSDGRSYAEVAPRADGTLSLPVFAAPIADKTALADQILLDAKLDYLYGDRWDAVWEALGASRLEAAILRSKASNNVWNWTWKEFLLQMARREPPSFLARGEALMAHSDEIDAQASAVLAQLRARSDNPVERQKAQAWLDTRAKKTLGMSAQSVTELLYLASVAHALRAGEGAKWLEFAAQIAAQLSEKTREDGAREWGRIAAPLGRPALDNLLLDWEVNAKLNAFDGAITAWCEAGNLAAARETLGRMEDLLPDAQKAKAQVVTESWMAKPKDIVAQARGAVAGLLVKTDPQGALELSKTTQEHRATELLLLIGKNAARLGQKPLAERALRAVLEIKYSNVEPSAQAAEIALDFDPQLADELFAVAREKVKPSNSVGYQPSIAAYAGARAKVSPGESRILIEREWKARIAAYKPPKDNDWDGNTEALRALINAMAQIEPRRALEMAAQLPEKGDGRAKARGEIAIALLSR